MSASLEVWSLRLTSHVTYLFKCTHTTLLLTLQADTTISITNLLGLYTSTLKFKTCHPNRTAGPITIVPEVWMIAQSSFQQIRCGWGYKQCCRNAVRSCCSEDTILILIYGYTASLGYISYTIYITCPIVHKLDRVAPLNVLVRFHMSPYMYVIHFFSTTLSSSTEGY